MLKKILWRRCFHVNFAKFLRTRFLWNTSGGWFCKWWIEKAIFYKCAPKVNEVKWLISRFLSWVGDISSKLVLVKFILPSNRLAGLYLISLVLLYIIFSCFIYSWVNSFKIKDLQIIIKDLTRSHFEIYFFQF